MSIITPDLLVAAMNCRRQDAERFAEPLAAACACYGITTGPRLTAFLAQIGHESGALRYTSELWGPSPAQRRYEGRADLGNTQPGDGERFKGRGLIQTTGRYNHARVRDRLRERFPTLGVPDFEAEPERLTEPQWAAMSAADYWDWKDLNTLADAGDFVGITRKINGGTNGLADRQARWERAKAAVLAEDYQPAPDRPTAAQPAPAAPTPARTPTMPLAPILAAVLPSIVSAIPALGKLFGSGSDVAERNVKAAEIAVGIVQEAVGARNAQEAAEVIAADPAQAQAAREAVSARWMELTEAGGDGIAGARKADAAATGGKGMLHSPSFWIAAALLPLVYMIVGSVVGLFGVPWSDDVRSAIANGVVGMVLGSIAGYYFGQTTSRNRTPAP